jgi:PAS domain S-box-containing protein
MTDIAGYTIEEVLFENSVSGLCRGVRVQPSSQPLRALIRYSKRDEPGIQDRVRLRKEYEISKDLDVEGVLKPLELVTGGARVALIYEDFKGVPLSTLIGSEKFELDRFLHRAIRLSEILGSIHGRGIIHKDIKPQNILVGGVDSVLKLTGFAFSSPFSGRNAEEGSAAETLEGTLAYMSPEQTGRMNRAVDYRSDLYSLGLVLYEMVTGRPAFREEEALALVHAQMAKNPVPPDQVNERLPDVVSRMIMKLVSKAPEERYQSSYGLGADLKRCLSELEQSGAISPFEPGEEDLSPLFEIPARLYGRDLEVQTLAELLDRARKGGRVCALIAGHSGMGKTSLVREFNRSLIDEKVTYISGTFERLQLGVPYSGFIQAFKALVDQILMTSEDQVALWKDRILKAVGSNGQVIVDVIPQVELILGTQKPVPELAPAESQNRFHAVFESFVGAFSRPEHPVLIFLDDLQWADTASLELFRILSGSPALNHMLILGAYRDEEIDSRHPLHRMLAGFRTGGSEILTIDLQPLTTECVNLMVSNTLKCTGGESQSLSRLIYDKTGGNPFFVNEFLRDLYRKGHTHFDFTIGRWVWDMDEILQTDVSDDLVGFMTGKIRRLSGPGQQVLMVAACMGNRFPLRTLAAVHGESPRATLIKLQESILEGLVLPVDAEETDRSRETAAFGNMIPFGGSDFEAGKSSNSYRFLHDRVQQAAYSLLTPAERQQLHLEIGRYMLAEVTEEEFEERVCEIADHMNRGRPLVKGQEERRELAALNLAAGKRAKASIAYHSAVSYIGEGLEMLTENSWRDSYELMLSLHLEGAEAAYLSADFTRAEELNRAAIMHGRTLLDRARAFEIALQSLIAQNRYQDAVEEASTILNQLGVFLPRNPGRLRILLGLLRTKLLIHGISHQDLVNLPQMKDPNKIAAMRILMGVFNPFYRSIREMFPSIAFRMVILSCKYGNSEISPFAYALYGLLLGLVGDVDPGYQFGDFALKLFERYHSKELIAKMYTVVYALMKKWKAPLKEALPPLLEAYHAGLETGDFEWAAYAIRSYCLQFFFSGAALERLKVETERYRETLGKIKQHNTLHNTLLVRQVVSNLMGEAEDSVRLRGDSFHEEEMIPQLVEANDSDTIAGTRFFRCLLCYLFEDYRSAYERFQEIERQRETRGQFGFLLEMRFYYALVLLAVIPNLDRTERKHGINLVASYQKMMKRGADHAPMNYQHKWYLVEAERERVLGRDRKAMELYDRAIEGAKSGECTQDEALANELAARFYLTREKQSIATAYLREARSCYERWGAHAKVRSLDERYGNLTAFPGETKASRTAALSSAYEAAGIKPGELDLVTMLKVSQVISGEIVLGALLEKTMRMVMESSGAERGFLILERNGDLLIEAEGDSDTGRVELLGGVEASSSRALSQAALNYVIRTKQSLVLKEAREDDRFRGDPYTVQKGLKSLLCAPIVHQGIVKGLIYLENNLTSGAFTEERVEIVRLVAAQAAISLENARLYQSLLADIERRKAAEAELRISEEMARSLLDALRDSLVLIDREGRVLSLNTTTARSLGVKADEITGARLWDLYPPEVAARRKSLVERAVRTVRAVRVVDEQGDRISDNVIYPIVDSSGKVTRIAILERDITEQRKVEEQVKVQQVHLMRSDRLAMMGELAAGVAHEINNPNHSILLNAGLLLRTYPDILTMLDEHREELEGIRLGGLEYEQFRESFASSVKRIDECAKRIGVIVKEMKSFASQEPEALSEPVDVNVAVQSAIVLGTPFIKKATDRFSVQLEENVPRVRGNAQKIEQVLLNLLQNACQSLRDRSGAVTIATHYEREPRLVVIEIGDEGEGMSQVVLERLKEPFFTTRRGSGGTGLGLSISSRIVDAHGGTLQFRSQPGKGTVVAIKFPEGVFP